MPIIYYYKIESSIMDEKIVVVVDVSLMEGKFVPFEGVLAVTLAKAVSGVVRALVLPYMQILVC